MSVQLTRQGFRLLADERSRNPMLDVYTQAAPQAWARADSQFEIALGKANKIVDVANLSSVSIRGVDKANIDGGSLFAKTVAGADLDQTLTDASWADGSRQHALFRFSSAEMNLLTSTAQREIFVVITAMTSGGERFVCGTTVLTMVDDGAFQDADSPPANSGSAITVGDADARYAPAGTASFFSSVVTSVGDNATGALERLVTVGVSIPALRTIRDAGVLRDWILDAGTAANSSDADGHPNVQRPTDYNATTNARVWTRWR